MLKGLLLLSGCIMITHGLSAQSAPGWLAELRTTLPQRYSGTNFTDLFLYARLSEQCLYVVEGWEIVQSYEMSGATVGAGQLAGSHATPLGLHRISEKFGEGLPPGAILRARKFTGEIAEIFTDTTDVPEDYVTTRILWLDGMEPGKNKGRNDRGKVVDSHDRYIYIHGTPEEGLIGRPASHGCLRLRNAAVIELFDRVDVGTPVLIDG